MSPFFVKVVFFNDFGSTFEASLNAYGSLCVPFVHTSFSSFFHRFPGPPGCRLLRGRRERRHPLKSGRGFPQETLQAVREAPRMVLKNNDNDKVLLILFKGVPPLPPTSQLPAAGGAPKSMKKL